MFDTMTFTKVLGAVCGSLLLFLFAKWGAESLYHVGAGGHGYDEEKVVGYLIETEGADAEPEEEVVEVDFATVLASADAGKGARVFNKCKACHKLEDGENATGPHLYDVVGRAVAAADGFGYSGALSEAADVWSAENLNAFLEDPRGYAPGTSMSFRGLGDVEDRANLIAYLDTIGE